MLNPQRIDLRRALCAWGYIGILLLGCSNKSWQAAPAAPPAPVEQKSSLQLLREKAEAERGKSDPALNFAHRVADELEGGASLDPSDPQVALELLDAAAQTDPLRAADLAHARGRVLFAQQDYQAAVITFEENARSRGHAHSATAAVSYFSASGARDRLTTFCNEVYPLIRGGNDKNVFISECVAGMGYASPAEWRLVSGPALQEYERWRAESAAAEQEKKQADAAAARAEQDRAAAAQRAEENSRNCILRCQEKEALCKADCYNDQCRDDCSDAEWACRRQC